MPDGDTIVRQALDDSRVYTGEDVISQNIISAISKIQETLENNFQINLTQALVTSPVRLNVQTNENWQIYFSLDAGSDIGSQITKLDLLLKSEISSGDIKNLRYIDLRPKNRAVICDNQTCGGQ